MTGSNARSTPRAPRGAGEPARGADPTRAGEAEERADAESRAGGALPPPEPEEATLPPEPAADTPPVAPEAEVARLRDLWLRAEAELQNYRRRAQRDVEEARRGAEEGALLEVIELLDDLDRALEASATDPAQGPWLDGVRLVAQRMRDYLTRSGVTAIAPVGERFDPRLHEAMIELDAPEGVEPGAVVAVIRRGYRRGDRLLRAARVAVARRPPGDG